MNNQVLQGRQILKDIITENIDSAKAYIALDWLWKSYKNTQSHIKTLFYQIKNNFSEKKLAGLSFLNLSGYETLNKLQMLDSLTNIYPDTSLIPLRAKYAKFLYCLNKLKDRASAESILSDLQSNYPNSLLTKDAENLLSINQQLGKKNDHKVIENLITELFQNYPNPFNPVTAIEFSIQKRERVTVKIYDILGCEVATLMDEIKEPGKYKTYFKWTDIGKRNVYLQAAVGE